MVPDLDLQLTSQPEEALRKLSIQNTDLHPLDWQKKSHVKVAENVFDVSLCYWAGAGTAIDTTKALSSLVVVAK